MRVNKETQDHALATSVKTHASTKQVCGTGPYMPPGTLYLIYMRICFSLVLIQQMY